MCLSSIEKFRPCTSGYKVMCVRRGFLYGEFLSILQPRPIGVWLRESKFRIKNAPNFIYLDREESYKAGWHVYHTLKDTKNHMRVEKKFSPRHYAIVAVDVRGATATGYQRQEGKNVRVTVAKEIKITAVLDC